jgi:hypothetical protein
VEKANVTCEKVVVSCEKIIWLKQLWKCRFGKKCLWRLERQFTWKLIVKQFRKGKLFCLNFPPNNHMQPLEAQISTGRRGDWLGSGGIESYSCHNYLMRDFGSELWGRWLILGRWPWWVELDGGRQLGCCHGRRGLRELQSLVLQQMRDVTNPVFRSSNLIISFTYSKCRYWCVKAESATNQEQITKSSGWWSHLAI